ncbi:MAG: PH domain-containing protein [Streptosporangiaceae bacterium]
MGSAPSSALDAAGYVGVSPRLWPARQVQWAASAVPVTAGGTVAGWLTVGTPLGAGLLVGLVIVSGLWWRGLRGRYRSWGYQEREDDLLVRRGIIFRRLSVVPYGRMQFVDVTAGPVERWFGLATVQLHTAAAATDARIPGLASQEAQRLRDRLASLGEARAAGL